MTAADGRAVQADTIYNGRRRHRRSHPVARQGRLLRTPDSKRFLISTPLMCVNIARYGACPFHPEPSRRRFPRSWRPIRRPGRQLAAITRATRSFFSQWRCEARERDQSGALGPPARSWPFPAPTRDRCAITLTSIPTRGASRHPGGARADFYPASPPGVHSLGSLRAREVFEGKRQYHRR